MKEIVIKDSARSKGTKAYMDAVSASKRMNKDTSKTKHGINIRKLAKRIILF